MPTVAPASIERHPFELLFGSMKLRPSVRRLIGFVWLSVYFSSALLPTLCRAQRIELNDPEADAIVLDSASISTEVTGRIAVTTFNLVFRNQNARILDGTLVFPLLDGQRVMRFGLDVNGSLREAVPVQKERRRTPAGEITRQSARVRNGESTAARVYRARIYPFPAHGTRHVRLAYQEDLAPVEDQTTYRLSLDFPRLVSQFRLALNVHPGASLPAELRTTLDLQVPPWRNGQFMEIERENFDARGVFEIILPKADRPRVVTGRYQNREYFYGEVPNMPLLLTRPPPKVIGLLWDSSASGRERNHEREYALLSAWFANLKNVEVRLLRIRNRVTRDASFSVNNGHWQALQKELEATVYDGATSLDGLIDDPKIDAWVVFSDGVFNYGALEPSANLPLRGVIHTVASNRQSNSLWLKTVAANRGGEYINLHETEVAQAVFTLESHSPRILAIEYDPEAVSDVYPLPGKSVLGDSFPVTGVLRKKDAKVRILVGHSRENAQPIELNLLSGDDPSELAPRTWALARIEQLSINERGNREDIRRTCFDFGIVRPGTSLLVLETVSDYLRHNVTPPEELQEEWEARQPAGSESVQEKADHLQAVLQAFEQRMEWWGRSFPTELSRQGGAPATSTVPFAPGSIPADGLDDDSVDSDTSSPSGSILRQNRSVSFGREPIRNSLSAPEAFLSESPDEDMPNNPESALQSWSPQSGYLDRLSRAASDRRHTVYLEERPEHQREPGFYLDCADFFLENGDVETGLRILSNLAELEPDHAALLRVLAYRLLEVNRADLAAPVLEHILVLRAEEPQSRRDLARAYAMLGKFQRAVDLLWEIVSKTWDTRFPDIELIALEELNAIVATCNQKLDLSRIDPRLQKNLPLDLRVILSWDASDCDIDLWVGDPNGQVAKYDFPVTRQGGVMSRDFTGGYGPEEFTLRHAKPGTYVVKINYYGDRRQTTLGPVTAEVRLITGFGTARQQEKRLTMRLKEAQETLDVGVIEIGAKGAKSEKARK